MDVAPPPHGSRLEDLGDRLVVRFRPRLSWAEIVFLVIWLVAWTGGGIAAFGALRDAAWGERLFLLVWICGWAAGECMVPVLVAWLVAGRELLIVTPESLEVRQQIRRFARTKRYDVGLVEDVTGARVPTDEDERPRADFCLRISYDGKHVKVGEGMGEREAEYVASRVLALIRPRTWWGEDERCEERPAAAAKQRSLWGSIVFPAIVIAVLVALAVMSLAPGHRHSTPAASAPRPAPTAPSSPREYASVRTLESLYLSRMNVFGRPRCKVEATWKRWGCTVRAQSTIGPFAGLTLTYRCYSDVDAGPGILCSPVDPPPIND